MIERFAGRYALLQPLGRGGMGEVFLARDLTTGAECALKRLHHGAGREMSGILEEEFRSLTRARHPAVVSVFELGFAPDGRPFFTMEYVPGLPADRAVAPGNRAALGFVAVRFALGLEALHELGIVHGDLKPSNLLVVPGPAPDGLPAGVRLVDFGLARLERESGVGKRGAPGFAAPEVVQDRPPDAQADLYGLGATLFVLATGRRPFEASSVTGVLRLQQAGPPASSPLEDAGVPAPLVQLILRLMSPTPAERGDGAREVRQELERIFPEARRPLIERVGFGRIVGRERELARIESWLAESGSRVKLVIVAGAEGSGTTSLLDEIAARAAMSGRGIVRLSGSTPAGAAARVLTRRLIGDGASAGGASLEDGARRWLESEDAPLEERDIGPLAEAALARVRGGNESAAQLVLVDDSHALDAPTRALIRRLVLAGGGGAPRAIWARRGTRASLPPDDRALVGARVAELIELGPLEHAEVERLASARLGAPAPEPLVEWLWARGAGHPGFTVELLRHGAAAGAIVEDDAGLRASAAKLETLAAPENFEASGVARWSALPADARAAAAALAAWGRAVTAEELRGVEPRASAGVIELLRSEGIASRDAAGAIAFRPPALGSRVLDALEPDARRAIHESILRVGRLSAAERFEHLRAAGQVEAALAAAETAFAEHADDRLAAAAAAMCEATAPRDAARWYERAGRALFDRARHGAAAPMFEKALALDPSGPERHARRALLAQAWFRAGMLEAMEALIEAALGDDPPAAERAKLLTTRSNFEVSGGHFEAAVRGYHEARAIAEPLDNPVENGLLSLSLAFVLLRLGRIAEAEAEARSAIEWSRRGGDVRGALRATSHLAAVARHGRRYKESERVFSRGIEEARAAGDRFAIEELLGSRHALLTELGRWREARADLAEALRIALEDGRASGAAGLMTARALLDGLTGRVTAARRHGRAAARMCRAAYPAMQATALRALAQAERIRGSFGQAERYARRALSHTGVAEVERDWQRFELGRTLLATGRGEGIHSLMSDRENPASSVGSGWAALALLVGRAEIRQGQDDKAERLLAAATAWRGDRPLAFLIALEGQLRAEIAFSRGRLDLGGPMATATLEQFAALPAVPDRAFAALDYARLCPVEMSDSRAPVSSWLDEAAAGFQRLGNLSSRERALALLVRHLRRAHPTGDRAGRAQDLIIAVRRLLDSLSDLRELAQRAMRLAVEQLDAERGVLLLMDSETDQLMEMAEHGAVDAGTRRSAATYSRRIVERVARQGGAVLLGDALSDPASLSESIVDLQLKSILCVPMYVGGRVIGAVYLDDARRADAFSEEDRALLEGFAQLIAVAFEKSRGQEEVARENQKLLDENIQLRQQAGVRFQTQNLIAVSSEMRRVLSVVETVAHSDATVLLTGENGTGKELIALTLHHNGKRRGRPFIPVNCGAIPEAQLEAELFGILPRTATDVAARPGRFVEADGGTLFLDEVADMPPSQQVALLRVLSSREVTPVGGGKPIPVDVRIIAATNRDLTRRVESGEFREDLYHRLNVIPIEIPPLRDHKADIPMLARHFAAEFAKQQQRENPELSPELLAALMQSDWPGNVRALQNYIERIMAMNPGSVLYPRPLPRDLDTAAQARSPRGRTLQSVEADVAQRMIQEALVRSGGNKTAAARELGMTEQTLRYRLRKYSIGRTRRYLRPRKK